MRRFFGKLLKRKSKRTESTVVSGNIMEEETADVVSTDIESAVAEGNIVLAESTEIGPIFAHIVNLKHQLSGIIEPDFGLLDHLLRLQVLTRRQYNKIRAGDKTAYERNEAVLDMLETEDQCDKFLKALQRTGQQHVVTFIMANGGQKSICQSLVLVLDEVCV